MKPASITIAHFRALRDVSFSLDRLTILVGTNGVGKSTVLHALEFFFNPRASASAFDSCGNAAGPVEVTVTCGDLLPQELERFTEWLSADGRLTLTKRSQPGEYTRYLGRRLAHAAFQEIRETHGAAPQRAMYRTFIDDHHEYDLPAAGSAAQALANLRDWEREHPGQCLDIEIPVDISLSAASISSYTEVRLISAVQDAQKAVDSASSPLRAVISEGIIEPVSQDASLRDLRADIVDHARQIFSAERTPALATVQSALTDALQRFAPGAAVQLRWEDAGAFVALNVPGIDVEIVEDGYAGNVSGKGHGVQRGVLFAALFVDLERLRALAGEANAAHDLILLIEEPELYLHPTRARYYARVLLQIVGAHASVVLATHSPFFTGLRDFASIRILRRGPLHNGIPSRTVAQTTLAHVAQELAEAHGADASEFTPEGLAARIPGVLDTSIREGYFARKVVLCEGDEDAAIVRAVLDACDCDVDALDVAVLTVNGKSSLDRALVILRQLGVPSFLIFDGDRQNLGTDDAPSSARLNRALLTLVGARPVDFPDTRIAEGYAVWTEDFGRTLESSFPDPQQFRDARAAAARKLGYQRAANKNPDVLREALRTMHRLGLESPLLRELADAISAFAEGDQ